MRFLALIGVIVGTVCVVLNLRDVTQNAADEFTPIFLVLGIALALRGAYVILRGDASKQTDARS